ncbi:MAG: MFS transporter [Actinobacteria bacterium]|nr:MAG: MFS transporter [Actinomycetota bacterium]
MTLARFLSEPADVFGRVARNGNVLRLELAWAGSNLGSRASAVGVAVYAYQANGIAAVGVVAAVRLAFAALAAPWLAVFADRRPRRQVLMVSDLLRCVLFAAIAAAVVVDAASLLVYALAVGAAVAEPVFRSAQAAFTPSLVSTPEELTAANVVASTVESIGLFAGPALGGLLLVVAGTATVFAASTFVLLVSVVLVAAIDVPGLPRADDARPESTGWRAIASNRSLRIVVGLFSIQTLVAGMLNVLVVVIAIELLGLGKAGVGWLDGTVGIGATAGVLVVAAVTGRGGLAKPFALGLVLWGLPLVLIAVWPQTVAAFALMALLGVGNTLVDVAGVTLMQRGADDDVIGRVFGAFESLALVAMGAGSLLAPLLVSLLGTRGAVLVAGSILPLALVPLWRPLLVVDTLAAAPQGRIDLLRSIPIFAPLALPELERLAQAARELRIAGGSSVFEEGEAGDRFFAIAEGRAAVESRGARLRELGAGDFFGEIALLRDVPRTATVRALTALRLVALERPMFLETVTGHAASAEAAGSIVAARLRSPVGN